VRLALRQYQTAAIEQTIRALDRRPVLVAPTGSGKTVMAVELVRRLGARTLWLAHRKELIDQAARQLCEFDLSVGRIMAGEPIFPAARIQVASIQTLVRRKKPRAQLVVIDECHHAAADTYQSVLDDYPDASIVGLTATPFRLDGRPLGDLFGEIVVAAWTDDLCVEGYLHRPRVYAPRSPDLRGVKVTAGDYNRRELAERVDTDEQNADIVKSWQKHALGKRTVAFAVDVQHSKDIVTAFRQAGVAAEHLDAKTPRVERAQVLKRLRTGETRVLSNCMILTEGWDLPALECAIVARPTASLNLHLQMIGRVMRASGGKLGAIVLDHAGNHHVHGLATRRLNYALDGEKIGSSEPLGLRRCRQCGLFFEITTYACPECGWVPAPSESVDRERPPIHGEGELVEFDDSAFEYQQQVWRIIESERMAQDYKPGWSFYRFEERFGFRPIVASGELVDPARATQEQKRAVFEQFSRIANERGYKPGWASHRYRDVFGFWPRGFVGDVRGPRRLDAPRADELRRKLATLTT